MEIGQDFDGFINSSIDHTKGVNLPNQNLHLKVDSLGMVNYRLRDRCLFLQAKLLERGTSLQLARAEANMNAQAMKKFVKENQKLASECKILVSQCNKSEQECSRYDHDRDVLMEFGNEADERAKEAETRVDELVEKLKSVTDQFNYYKRQYEHESLSVESSVNGGASSEQILLNALVASLVHKTEVPKTASAFLEANSGVEMYRELLEMWNSLRPETRDILSLAGSLRTLQKAKEHLRINLSRAEEEVNVLAEENNALVEQNKKLLKRYLSERKDAGSEEKLDDSARAKCSKRKTSPGVSSPVDRKIHFNDMDSMRFPLSPLNKNSPSHLALKSHPHERYIVH